MTCLMPDIIAAPGSFGVGPDAQRIEKSQREIVRHAFTSSGGATFYSRVSAVFDAAESASEYDWDGYGARPAHPDAVTHAVRFFASLPRELPPPEVGVDPDGDIAFEWYSNDRVFSISVSPLGELHYAGRFGKNTIRGKESLTAHAFSSVLQPHLARVFSPQG